MRKAVLPYPPSVNKYLRFSPHGYAYTTKEAKAYKQGAKIRALTQGMRPIVEGEVCLSIAVYRPQKRGDIDNVLKVLLDALNGVAYTDDGQIAELHISRSDDPTNPRVEVWTSRIEAANDGRRTWKGRSARLESEKDSEP